MLKRRAILTGLLPILASTTAFAQETRQRRIRTDDGGAFMGGGMVVPNAPIPAPTSRVDIAPMPNSSWEAPRDVVPTDPNAPRFAPAMMAPTMPGRGLAQGNSQASINDRLFRGPAAGAQMRIPMSW
jgi:hypothetical protein